MMANCHCSDCRAATGAAYGTLLFVSEDSLEVQGTPKVFHHVADSGAKMEKHFCSDCGSQLFGKNSGRAGVVSIRAGGLDENDFVKPAVNVYLSSKIDSTPVDPDLKGFDKMPG
ncbi:MAG: GFA family protein [Alphaproteobacteria bacterium]|nr:GFA family protein [Alphaproteobacteria bacterium]